VKRLLLVIALAWVLVAGLSGSPEGQRVWFKFNKAFINAHYSDGEAFGTIKGADLGCCQGPHSTKCGGIDGELHVGALGGRRHCSRIPIANLRQGGFRRRLASCSSCRMRKRGRVPQHSPNTGKTVTSTGYFRVWNEGHWKGPVRRGTRITCSTCIRRGDYDRNVSPPDLPCSKDLRNHLTTRLIRVD
jgi:hypothetical protein